MTDNNDFYWDWLKHEDNLFTNRNNLLIVAESMLIAALATLTTSNSNKCYAILMAIGGLFITLIWILASLKHLVSTDKPLKNILHEFEKRRATFDYTRNVWWHNHWLIGFILPMGLIIVWVLWLWFLII